MSKAVSECNRLFSSCNKTLASSKKIIINGHDPSEFLTAMKWGIFFFPSRIIRKRLLTHFFFFFFFKYQSPFNYFFGLLFHLRTFSTLNFLIISLNYEAMPIYSLIYLFFCTALTEMCFLYYTSCAFFCSEERAHCLWAGGVREWRWVFYGFVLASTKLLFSTEMQWERIECTKSAEKQRNNTNEQNGKRNKLNFLVTCL